LEKRTKINKEAHYEAFINDIPAIIWITEADGSCSYLNGQWYDFTGQEQGEAEGFGWTNAIHPEDKEAAGKSFIESNEKMVPYNFIYRLRKKDGNYRWSLDKGKPRFSDDGTYIGMIGTVVDMHEQKVAEEESKQNLRSLVESAPFPIGVYIGSEMRIALANQSIIEVYGKGQDVIGKLYKELLPELQNQEVFDQLDQVYATGIPFNVENQYIDIIEDGRSRPYYFNYSLTPLFDSNGKVYGIINTAADVTDLNVAKKTVEESELKFRSIIEQAPVATCLFTGQDLKVEIANQKMIDFWGKGPDIMGKPLEVILPELRAQGFIDILQDLFETGKSHTAVGERCDLVVNGVLQTFYFDFTYKALKNAAGNVYGVMNMAIDVTDSVIANQRIEENQQQLLASFEQSPVGIAIISKDNDLTFTMANPFYGELTGRKPSDIVGKPLLKALPELVGLGFDDLLKGVINTGVAHIAREVKVELLRDNRTETVYIDFTYQPKRDADKNISGVLVVVIDVTQQVLSRKKVETSEAKLRSVIDSAPAGIGLFVGRDLIIEMPNKMFIDIVGKGPDITSKPLREVMPELLTEGQPFLKILDDVYTSGKMFQSYGSEVRIVQNGVMTYNYYNITYSPLFDENGEVYGILDIAIDVTDTIRAKQLAEEAEAALRGAVELAELATWSLNINNNTFNYSKRFIEWLGFSEDSKSIDEAYNPVPEEFRNNVAAAISDAIKPGGSGNYINEHPIINSLTGQERIIHAQAQVFYDVAGNPEVLRGTAQDVTRERKLQQQLEYQVKKRTEELEQANAELAEANNNLHKTNAELAQFAYIASHDLQEPVRKINIFAKMLEDSLGDVDAQSKNYLSKLNSAAVRMMNLIRDVLAYSQLAKENEQFVPVDLKEVVHHIVTDFDLIIEQKHATVSYESLPSIDAIPLQMAQLFGNLISNSIKYSKEDVPPVISISASIISGEEAVRHGITNGLHHSYHKIEIKDNGIGFDQQHAEQIFNIFQRLHGKLEYVGTGIGLAMCKKIAENHHGNIYALADRGNGATFVVLLPVREG